MQLAPARDIAAAALGQRLPRAGNDDGGGSGGTRARRDRDRRRAARRGRRRAPRRGGSRGRDRRGAPRRRRVLVLRLHAVEGAAAARSSSPPRRGAYPASRRGALDVAAVLARRDEVIHDLDDSRQLPWLEERGVTLVRGHGRLDGERRVARRATSVLAARDARSSSPPAAPPRSAESRASPTREPWTNIEATTAKQVPRAAVRARRRRRRRRDGAGLVGARLARDARAPGRPR